MAACGMRQPSVSPVSAYVDAFEWRRALASKRGSIATHSPPPAKARVDLAKRNLGPARDFRGYGAELPEARWPGGARIAVNINLNVEAGGDIPFSKAISIPRTC